MTEKKRPAYGLPAIKETFSSVEELQEHATSTALKSAALLGVDFDGVVEIIQTIDGRHFVKSMTSYADHRVWQDVYHVPSQFGVLYIKFTKDKVTDFKLLSFKEKDDG